MRVYVAVSQFHDQQALVQQVWCGTGAAPAAAGEMVCESVVCGYGGEGVMMDQMGQQQEQQRRRVRRWECFLVMVRCV